jgi:hypothetical protein
VREGFSYMLGQFPEWFGIGELCDGVVCVEDELPLGPLAPLAAFAMAVAPPATAPAAPSVTSTVFHRLSIRSPPFAFVVGDLDSSSAR